MAHPAEAQRLRLRFLESAARRVCFEAKTTSGQLMRESIACGQSEPNATTPAGICRACGAFLIPGWTLVTAKRKMSTSAAVRERRQNNCQAGKSQQTMLLRCQACQRVCRVVQKARSDPARACNAKQPAPKPLTTKVTADVEPQPLDTAQSSHKTSTTSKQRAKARKDRQGLQALASKLGSGKPSNGLNLMDLMAK
jgi:hypothetical protein